MEGLNSFSFGSFHRQKNKQTNKQNKKPKQKKQNKKKNNKAKDKITEIRRSNVLMKPKKKP